MASDGDARGAHTGDRWGTSVSDPETRSGWGQNFSQTTPKLRTHDRYLRPGVNERTHIDTINFHVQQVLFGSQCYQRIFRSVGKCSVTSGGCIL